MIGDGNPPSLFAGDCLELLLSALAAVGLEPAAVGKVTVAFVPELGAAKDLARAGGCEVVFSNVHSHCGPGLDKGGIGGFGYKIQIPIAPAENKL